MKHPKSKYVGNHGGRYTDMDGMTKQFTYIDYDKKTTISKNMGTDEEVKEELKKFRDDTIAEILALPAVAAVKGDPDYEILVKRDADKGVIWDQDAVIERCINNWEFRRVLYLITWRNTVMERYWFEEMSHEDILAGKWKQWMH